MKRLDAYVFWGCNHLEEVVLGKGLTSVDEYAFSGCTGLKQITIPENVQSIDAQAFAGCTNLTDIYIPDTVTSIAESSGNGSADGDTGGRRNFGFTGNNRACPH